MPYHVIANTLAFGKSLYPHFSHKRSAKIGDLMKSKTKVLSLILVSSMLLILAVNSSIFTAKAQTNDSVYLYTSLGGTISISGTTIPGGTSYPFANGTAVDFVANASTDINYCVGKPSRHQERLLRPIPL